MKYYNKDAPNGIQRKRNPDAPNGIQRKRNPDAAKPGPKPGGEPLVTITLAVRPHIVEKFERICAERKLMRSAGFSDLVKRYRLESERTPKNAQ